MHLALYQPQVPGNTGNIGRLCVGMGATLEIIGPCAFDFSDKALRRAGLDYWPHLTWTLHPSPDAFLTWLGDRQPWLVSKFGALRFDQAPYHSDDVPPEESEGMALHRACSAANRRTRLLPPNGPLPLAVYFNPAALPDGIPIRSIPACRSARSTRE